MSVTHVQYLGGVLGNTIIAHTTTVLSISKTVTAGNLIVVGFGCRDNLTPTQITDNLGNTYTQAERRTTTNATANLWYAFVTAGGTLTTITVSHSLTYYTAIVASEFSGMGTFMSAGRGLIDTATTLYWADCGSAPGQDAITVPASGLVVGIADQYGQYTHSAGAAAGSPSTSISLAGQVSGNSVTLSLAYAIPGASPVTGFYGSTTSSASAAYAGAGAIFNAPSAIKTINGLARASVKTVNGLAIASMKGWDGVQ